MPEVHNLQDLIVVTKFNVSLIATLHNPIVIRSVN